MPLRQTAIRISDELRVALQRIKDEEGIPISVQVRKALESWVRTRGVTLKKAERTRAATRRRS
jgi:hypothetical protein